MKLFFVGGHLAPNVVLSGALRDTCRLEPPPQRIAILRALGGLGDLLCAVPTFRSLRIAFPQAEITLIGLPQIKELVGRFNPYLDNLLEFPGYPGLPERSPQLSQIPGFFAAAQHHRFDLAIQMHGSGILTNPLTVLLGAQVNAGFFLAGEYCPHPDCFLPYAPDESEVRRYLRLVEFLGIPGQGEALEFPLSARDRQDLQKLEAVSHLLPAQYVCIHPGASVSARRWFPEQFAAVGDISADLGFRVVLTGSVAEVGLAQAVAEAMKGNPINLAGQTSLGALAALLSEARLLVCNDTGVSHLAAALQTPSIVIFTDSDPARWAPLNRMRHRVICASAEPSPLKREVVVQAAIAQAQDLLQHLPQEKVYATS